MYPATAPEEYRITVSLSVLESLFKAKSIEDDVLCRVKIASKASIGAINLSSTMTVIPPFVAALKVVGPVVSQFDLLRSKKRYPLSRGPPVGKYVGRDPTPALLRFNTVANDGVRVITAKKRAQAVVEYGAIKFRPVYPALHVHHNDAFAPVYPMVHCAAVCATSSTSVT
jgi:hypothetical protein